MTYVVRNGKLTNKGTYGALSNAEYQQMRNQGATFGALSDAEARNRIHQMDSATKENLKKKKKKETRGVLKSDLDLMKEKVAKERPYGAKMLGK